MNSTRPGFTLLTLMLVLLLSAALTLALSQIGETQSRSIIIVPTADPTILAQDARKGYEVFDEAILIERSRAMVGIEGEIEAENIFYVKAGYWQETRSRMDYRDKPDHPIFVYSIKGDIKGFSSFGAPSSDPNAPTPEFIIQPTTATVVCDAVTGQLIAYRIRFIEDYFRRNGERGS